MLKIEMDLMKQFFQPTFDKIKQVDKPILFLTDLIFLLLLAYIHSSQRTRYW